ncbi:5'-methylthioadenosine/adenosylhomocysteine nucleosidase [Fibrella sp. HMF5335]|uniref:5'-methylthioadenosine/adenosylhomocysteine nucleosidase n=1 Tax=Fibrella rubiginis TaxID=2817060 RepID=A0A939GJL6_9BACT|nr:5'-methylthioadenosine/adenosylhomocysteine nucleosidase [Fibrella rubiginis]MBO0938459.1 5'-methylthioadenosine/adenosylhomocysteine nucleosidase [Fibrella rubiginis]
MNTQRISFIIFCLLTSTQPTHAQLYRTRPITALLGAFEPELRLVRQSLRHPKTQTINGMVFTTGRVGKQRVVVAETGIGKVNAAAATAFVLAHFRPRRVLFTGIAGGTNPDLQPGDMVVGRRVAHHDYGWMTMTNPPQPSRQTRNAITKQDNPVYFLADSVLLLRAQEAAKLVVFASIPATNRPPTLVVGTIVTGDVFVSSEEKVAQLRRDYGADATEMEGAAVAQICYQEQVPCLVIRSLSDKANSNARMDMRQFLDIAARNSAKLVLALVKRLP